MKLLKFLVFFIFVSINGYFILFGNQKFSIKNTYSELAANRFATYQLLQNEKDSQQNNQKEKIKLEIDIKYKELKLWRIQKITIKTVPDANITTIAKYPNGSFNSMGSSSGIANNKGIYILEWKVSGPNDLKGEVEMTIRAQKDNGFNEVKTTFLIN